MEVCEAFHLGNAKSVIITVNDMQLANKAVVTIRRLYPDMQIFARAVNAEHQKRLQNVLGVNALVPIDPNDSIILSLPFGGEVLKSLGASPTEVEGILERTRKEITRKKRAAAGESGVSPVGEGSDEEEREALDLISPAESKLKTDRLERAIENVEMEDNMNDMTKINDAVKTASLLQGQGEKAKGNEHGKDHGKDRAEETGEGSARRGSTVP